MIGQRQKFFSIMNQESIFRGDTRRGLSCLEKNMNSCGMSLLLNYMNVEILKPGRRLLKKFLRKRMFIMEIIWKVLLT